MIPISFRGFPLNTEGLTSQFGQWYGRPGLRPVVGQRQGAAPLIAGVEQEVWQLPALKLMIDDEAADFDALRLGILRAFDTREGAGALIVADDDGGHERYVMAVCQEPTQEAGQGGDVFVATLVTAEQYWRSTATMTESGALTATGQTLTVTNEGELDSFPVATYRPTAGRTGSNYWKYRRFVIVPWRSPLAAGNYSIQLSGDNAAWDTTVLTPAKALDESSVGVLVDGNEVNRWFAPGGEFYEELAFDQADTRLRANLDFQGGLLATLAAALGSGAGDVADGIRVNEDISAYPPSGILYAAGVNELFYYLSRDVKRRTFHGVTRAAYGSTAAGHSTGATLEWIQHEVFIVYGPATGLAMEADDDYMPLFELNGSDNRTQSWSEDEAQPTALSSPITTRPGGWRPATEGAGSIFTVSQHFDVLPTDVLGLANDTPGVGNLAQWQIYCPVGIQSASFDFDVYETTEVGALKGYASRDGVNWTLLMSGPGSSGVDWYGWTFTTLNQQAMGWRYLKFEIAGVVGLAQAYQGYIYAGTELPPFVRLMPEVSNYALDVAIVNETTGEGIELTYPAGLSIGDEVEADSEGKTVVAEPFGRNIYQAMTKSSHRRAMLRLTPGENVLRVDEAGLAGADVIVTWQERFYS